MVGRPVSHPLGSPNGTSPLCRAAVGGTGRSGRPRACRTTASAEPVMDRQAVEGQGFDDVRQMPGGAIKLLNGLWADLLISHAAQGKCAHG